MTVAHSSLTGSDLHEPKGVASANAGDVYVADGAGSGDWLRAPIRYTEVTVAHTDVASAASKTLVDSSGTQQFKIRDIFLTGAGTNFSAGGDRTLSITDGTTTWSVIPNATLESLAAGRWGDTAVAWPTSAAAMNTASVAGTDIVAKYAGGTTDHNAGSLTLVIAYEQVA